MNTRKFLMSLAVLFLVSFMLGHMGFAQTKAEPPKGPQVTMTAKIIPDKVSGGYQLISIKPHEEFKVANVNDAILKDLADKGEPVKIEGRHVRGAYLVFIEKINGEAYP
jgi:hypothetical protein